MKLIKLQNHEFFICVPISKPSNLRWVKLQYCTIRSNSYFIAVIIST